MFEAEEDVRAHLRRDTHVPAHLRFWAVCKTPRPEPRGMAPFNSAATGAEKKEPAPGKPMGLWGKGVRLPWEGAG